MTSLSSQLKSLQLPDELSVLNVQNKRASILFDAQDAADIDLDTIFTLGLSGLSELENIDRDFAKFEKMLFSESVKTLERTQQPADFNEKLDRKIDEFLAYLSPYVLIKPALKTLEWLIRRFRIHVFNLDSLMACILPYHETNLFARVLQILTLNKQNGKWEWLLSVQKASSPLSKITIIQHCVHNMSFQNFICEMVQQAIEFNKERSAEKLKTIISFYTSVMLGVIDAPGNLTETRIGKMLPFIYKGLKSNLDDYKASCYMILSKLSFSVTLEEQIVHALAEQLCKSLSSETAQFGILTMEYLYRKQKTKKFPAKALRQLCSSHEHIKQVLDCAEKNSIQNFQMVFISASVSHMLIKTQSDSESVDHSSFSVDYELVTRRCLQNMNLGMETVKYVIRQFLYHFVKLREVSTNSDALLVASRSLMKIFETRYPDATDDVVKEFICKNTKQSDIEWIETLFMGGLKSAKYTILPETHTLLSVSLNHPNPERRKMAVKEIIKRMSSTEDDYEDLDYVRNALIERLHDDEISVFEEVLRAGPVLVQLVGDEALLECLLKKLTKLPFSERTTLVKHIVELFQKYDISDFNSNENANKLFFELIPTIFPSSSSSRHQMGLFKSFSDSTFGSQHPFSEGIRKSFKEYDLSKLAENRSYVHELRILMLNNITEILKDSDQKIEVITTSLQFANALEIGHPFRTFLFSLLFKLFDNLSAVDIKSVIDQLQEIISKSVESLASIVGKNKHVEILLKDNGDETVFLESVKLSFSKQPDNHSEKIRFPRINMFCLFLKKILQILPKIDECIEEDNAAKSSSLQLFLYEVLATGSGRQLTKRPYVMVFRKMLQEFLKLNFGTSKDLLDFLQAVFSDSKIFTWLSSKEYSLDKIDVQVCSLHIFKVCLETLNNSTEMTLQFESQALPILLVLLHHPLKIIREASVGCIQALNDINADAVDSGLKYLLNFIVNNDTEIVEDRDQIQRVFEKLFKPLSHTNTDSEMLEPAYLEDLRFITRYLSSFLLHPRIHVQLGIGIITRSVIVQDFLAYLLPVLEGMIKSSQTTGLSLEEFLLLKILLQKFNPSNVDIFQKCPSSLQLFTTALELGKVCGKCDSTVQAIALGQVSRKFYSAISSTKTQSELFDTILNSTITTSNLNVSKACRETLVEIPVSPEDVARQIFNFKESMADANPKRAKRSRRMTKSKIQHEELDVVDSLVWNRFIILLEIMQQKQELEHPENFIVSFFDMLTCCLEQSSANHSSVEYMKQLLLSSLQRCLECIIASGTKGLLSQEKFNIASVIQCCRTSENPQTHHQALLLLGRAASLFPDLVLHNIMTIFTFMGDSVLRQDDSYSFEIIKKTIDSVIPTLILAGSGKSDANPVDQVKLQQTDDIVKLVVRVFVDAIPYIPEHRRIMLFAHLATVLNAERNLYIIIAILLEKILSQLQKSTKLDDQQSQDGSSLSQDFCQLLSGQFTIAIKISTMEKLVNLISNLSDEKKEESSIKKSTRSHKVVTTELVPLIDVTKYSTNEIRQFKYNVLIFISGIFSEESFVNEALNTKGSSLDNRFLSFLEEIMQFVGKMGNKLGAHAKEPSGKYWKMLLHKGSLVIDTVYKLLKFKTFLKVTTKLISNENHTIRKKAMELIGEKITSVGNFGHKQELKLVALANTLVDLSRHDSKETPVNKQTALYALKFLIRALTQNHTNDIANIVPLITNIFATDGANEQVSASALLCLAELCTCLEVRVVTFLPEFMPHVLKIFDDEANRNDLVLLGGITVLHKSVESISQFLSPYISSMLDIVTKTSLGRPVESTKTNSIRGQIFANICSIKKNISTLIAPRVFIPALDASIDKLMSSEKHSFQSLMEILQYSMEAISRENTKTYNLKILSLFLKAFDVRRVNSEKSQQEVDELEGSVVSAFCTLIMKLSENVFRPMFLKTFSWATSNDANKDRLLTFYRLCCAIAEKLKGLFLLFAGQIVKPCAELITKCYVDKEDCGIFDNETKFKTDILLKHILDCLRMCFNYDAQGFLNKERFEYLLEPLIAQIENQLGGPELYTERITNHLIPCVSSFASDISEESCWKTLNYQILLKTRSQNAQVRLSALKLLEEIHKKIGESYMVLLPETVPFLAELMEDESIEVEKQCQHVITQMEEILGESLQKYF